VLRNANSLPRPIVTYQRASSFLELRSYLVVWEPGVVDFWSGHARWQISSRARECNEKRRCIFIVWPDEFQVFLYFWFDCLSSNLIWAFKRQKIVFSHIFFLLFSHAFFWRFKIPTSISFRRISSEYSSTTWWLGSLQILSTLYNDQF